MTTIAPPVRATSPLPAVLAILLVGLLLAFAPGRSAQADGRGRVEAEFLELVNEARTARGLAPLAVAPELTAVARGHSAAMAGTDHLRHNPALDRAVGTWDRLGENVGRGGRAGTVHAALLASPSHRANLLDPGWRDVGIGVEVRDGVVWVTQVFRT